MLAIAMVIVFVIPFSAASTNTRASPVQSPSIAYLMNLITIEVPGGYSQQPAAAMTAMTLFISASAIANSITLSMSLTETEYLYLATETTNSLTKSNPLYVEYLAEGLSTNPNNTVRDQAWTITTLRSNVEITSNDSPVRILVRCRGHLNLKFPINQFSLAEASDKITWTDISGRLRI